MEESTSIVNRALDRGSPFRNVSDRWFEILLVTVILAATLVAHQFVRLPLVLLHFSICP
jgi:hypothetical protein